MGAVNQRVFEWLFAFGHRNELLDGAWIFLAKYLPALLVIGALALFFRESRRGFRWFFLAEAALSLVISRGLIAEAIKFFLHTARPFETLALVPLLAPMSESAFPSGHAVFLFSLAATVFCFYPSAGKWYFAFAAINGIARIVAGVHWPIDVVAGAAIGAAVALVVNSLLASSRKAVEAPPH